LLNGGYCLEGKAEPVQAHIAYFVVRGELIDHSLVPRNDPLAILFKLEYSPQWLYKSTPLNNERGDEEGKEFIAKELLQLLHSVYRIDRGDEWLQAEKFDQHQLDQIIAQVTALHIKWDATKNDYVFGDGSALPPEALYRKRIIWPLPQ
jgi:hypothetical protein